MFLTPTVDAWAATGATCPAGTYFADYPAWYWQTGAGTPVAGGQVTTWPNLPAGASQAAYFIVPTSAGRCGGTYWFHGVNATLDHGGNTDLSPAGVLYLGTEGSSTLPNAPVFDAPSPSPSPSPLPPPSPSPSPVPPPPTPAYSPPTQPEPSYDASQQFNPMGHFDRGDTGDWSDIGPWFASVVFAVVLVPFAWLTLVGAVRRFTSV